jgi:hypothetical protein
MVCVRITERERVRGSTPTSMHTARLRAQKAKRIGEAERSGEGGLGGFPRLRYTTTRPRAQQAKRSGEGAFLRLQCSTTRHEAGTGAASNNVSRFSSKFSALGNLAKPNRGLPLNALLCRSFPGTGRGTANTACFDWQVA